MSDVPEQTRYWDHLAIVVRGQTYGIFDWLDINFEEEPMSIVMCGHVDSGKSTTTGCILFQLDGIPGRELDQQEQDEESFEKSSLVFFFFMARQMEEWKRGGNTTCNTNEFFMGMWHKTISDILGRRDVTNNTIKLSSQADAALILEPADATTDKQFQSAGEIQGQTRQHSEPSTLLGMKQTCSDANEIDRGTAGCKHEWRKEGRPPDETEEQVGG